MADDTGSTIDELPIETIPEDEDASSESAPSIVAEAARDGSLALVAGGTVLVGAARSVTRGRLRAIVQLAVGAALVRIGLRQRRSAEETIDERVLGDRLQASDRLGEDMSDEPNEMSYTENDSSTEAGDDEAETGDDEGEMGDDEAEQSTQSEDAETGEEPGEEEQ